MRGTTTVRFFVPAAISTQMRALGPEGEAWLHILPDRIAVAEHDWQLSVGPAFDHRGAASWVAPAALKSGEEAVLKIGFPSVETRYEALALQAYDGKGAVKLLKSSSDGCTLLIERCLPGNDLWSVDLEHGNAVAAGMLERIWREPPARSPIQTLENLAAQWHERRLRRGARPGGRTDQFRVGFQSEVAGCTSRGLSSRKRACRIARAVAGYRSQTAYRGAGV